MTIRKAVPDDLDKLLSIYAYAREQMRLSGNPDQWKDCHPSLEVITNDIRCGNCYVITENCEEEIAGVFAFIIGEEPTYKRIEDGHWPNNDAYGTIHRIASNGKRKGVFRSCIHFCEAKAANIRVDTHERNYVMQHLLESSGYQKCGRIYVSDGSPRIAYQKVISYD